VQAAGCAPVVEAVARGADQCNPWPDPWTIASGLRVPAPFGGPLMLRAIHDSGGGAVAVSDEILSRHAAEISRLEGLDLSPEGGASFGGAAELLRQGVLRAEERVVLFNTGAGWLYRD
jgi:threonine synthase